MWASQEDALGGEVRMVMPDLPGFGRSRLEESGLAASVEACAEQLTRAGRPAVVVGVSYGGWVAVMLAANYPRLVCGLLISGVRPQIPRFLAELQATAFRVMPRGRLNRGEFVSNDDLEIERAHLVEASRELPGINLTSSLPRITADTVVFAPSRDWFVRRQAAQVAAAIPNARLEPLPCAGHLWTEQHPKPLTDCIRALASST